MRRRSEVMEGKVLPKRRRKSLRMYVSGLLSLDAILTMYRISHLGRSQEMPALREDCEQSSKCAPLAKHFAHCEEKVNAGEGFKGEDCIEEL